MIGKTISNLKIVSEIGKGGMGVVYKAEHATLPKSFAVKCISSAYTRNEQFKDRFSQEAKNQSRLDHPNIVQVTDFLEKDGFFFLVMEYVDGKALDDIIEGEKKLSEKEALSIFKDVLSGINFAHSKGIIHRDIKPGNIIVDKTGRARIMDFGIAILAGDKRLTDHGANIGSPWYMSPEQIKSNDIDHRSDVYAMGIVLYEMLTGNLPFDGETEFVIKEKHVKAPVPDPRQYTENISKKLSGIILKALEKKPDDRYSGCGEFLDYIKAYEKGDAPKKTGVWITAVIAVICILAAFTVFYYKNQETQQRVVQEQHARKKAEQNAEADRKAKERAEIKAKKEQTIREKVAKKAKEDMKTNERKAAYILIQSASEKAAILSRDIKEIPLKRQSLNIAEGVGDSGLADAYKKQIKEKEANVYDGLSAYGDFIKQLAAKQRRIVDEEFDRFSNVLTHKQSFRQIRTVDMIKRHYSKYLRENKLNKSYYLNELKDL